MFEFYYSQGLISLCYFINLQLCLFARGTHIKHIIHKNAEHITTCAAFIFFAPCIWDFALCISFSIRSVSKPPRRGFVNRDRFIIGCPGCFCFSTLLFIFNSCCFRRFFSLLLLHFLFCLSARAVRFCLRFKHLTLLRGAYRQKKKKKKSHTHMQTHAKEPAM